MNISCPVPWETLVNYWAGELAQGDEQALEEHLFDCAACTASSARVAAVTESLRAALPPLLTPERLAELAARGVPIVENPMLPGERKDVVFPAHVELLIHRLGGLDLSAASHVDFSLKVESTGHELVAIANAPFDRAGGAVLLACQKHYASLPPDTVAEVRVYAERAAPRVFRYTIIHQFSG